GDSDGMAHYRGREHLLGALAGHMIELDASRMTVRDTTEFLNSYFGDLGQDGVNVGRVIDGFIERRVLAQDGESIRFRHTALLNLFAAKWMNEPENVDFREAILADC